MTVLSVSAAAIDSGRLARANPVAKIGSTLLLGFGAALTADPVTPALILGGAAVCLLAGGIRLRAVLTRGWPLLLSAAGLGVTVLLFSDSEQPGMTALALVIRVLAIALPGVAVLMTIDPTDLADSLVQHLRVPATFAYASLAALRLLPLLAAEWRTIHLARRARGIDGGRNPLRHLRLFAGAVFTLLVGAIRRGTRLATAMDARGFDSAGSRTIARPQRFRPSDALLLVGTLALLGLAALVSSAIGSFRLLGG